MVETVTDIIVARSREPEGLKTMIVWSISAHIALLATALLWDGPRVNETPRTVMTVSLSGAPGPDTGGKTQIGDPSPPAPPPPEPAKPVVQTPPAAKPPAMTLPSPRSKPRPQPKTPQAPPDATATTPNRGEVKDTRPRGQGFTSPGGQGLSTSGGSGGAVSLDVTNFCCQEYLDQMASAIRQNWDQNQGIAGSTTMQFVILRNGTIQSPLVEKSSGFVALDNAALRALQLSKLSPLPSQFENPTLTVHLRFDFQR